MKDEALKLADWLDDGEVERYDVDEASAMIRRLVEELDKINGCLIAEQEHNEMLVKELDKQKYQNELLENSIKFAMLANNLQDKHGEPIASWLKMGLPQTPQTKPTITKLDGKVVAVTMTDDEHRITEVLWEAPKPLSDEEILAIADKFIERFEYEPCNVDEIGFAKAIEERHGIK